jgi:hypothetical protein
MCLNFCMLYYGDVNLTECKIYGYDRYKPNTSRERTLVAYKKQRYFSITHRLWKLFVSLKTFKNMTWHHLHEVKDGLCIYEFNIFGSFVTPYFYWLVILTVYNCSQKCVWGWNSCSYQHLYLDLIVRVRM